MTKAVESQSTIGMRELENIYHPDDVIELKKLNEFFPDYFKIIQEFGLGNLWQRPTLSAREKELVVLSTLITQGDSERQLRQHVYTSFNRQLDLNDILECIILLSVYIGVPRTYNAVESVQAVIKERS